MRSQWYLWTVVGVLAVAAGVAILIHWPWLYVGTFVVATVGYAWAMRRLALQGQDVFEADVVAEQIVALGIVSLIVHVVVAAVDFVHQWQPPAAVPPTAIREAAFAFLAGLSCAAFAPIVAVLSRSFRPRAEAAEPRARRAGPGGAGSVSLLGPSPFSMSDDGPAVSEAHRLGAVLSDAAEKLAAASASYVASIDQARTSLDEASAQSTRSLERLGSAIDTQASRLETAVSTLAGNLDREATVLPGRFAALSQSIDDGQKTLVEAIAISGERVRGAFDPVRGVMSGLATGLAKDVTAIAGAFEGTATKIRDGAVPLQTALEAMAGQVKAGEVAFADSLAAAAGAIRGSSVPLSHAFETAAGHVEASQDALVASLGTLGTRIVGAADPLVSGFGGLAQVAERAAAPLDATLLELGQTIQARTGSLAAAVDGVRTQLEALQASLSATDSIVAGSAAGLRGNLTAAAGETQTFSSRLQAVSNQLSATGDSLRALESLILTVRRFVSPAETAAETAPLRGRQP